MPRQRALRAVVHNTLDTLTSRYPDHDGYWVYGLVVRAIDTLPIDLLDTSRDEPWPEDPLEALIAYASATFREQLRKHRVREALVTRAQLTLDRREPPYKGVANGYTRLGHDIVFTMRVESHTGRLYEGERTVFVAPVDTDVMRRSTRRGPLTMTRD